MAVSSKLESDCPAAPTSNDVKWIRRLLIACACDLTLLRRRLLAARPQGPTGDRLDAMAAVLAAVEDALDAAVVRLDAEHDRRHAADRLQQERAA